MQTIRTGAIVGSLRSCPATKGPAYLAARTSSVVALGWTGCNTTWLFECTRSGGANGTSATKQVLANAGSSTEVTYHGSRIGVYVFRRRD